MSKLPSRKLLASLVAGALLLPQTGFTLGLGEIEVNSALNQKLNADIELLSATPEDAETIIIKLAPRSEFSRAGIDRPYSLNNLRFKAEIVNDVPYIKVTSGVPIREPFLNFLIEVDWPNGHLLREYTILLDPPVFMTQSAGSAPVTSPAADDDAEFRPAASGSPNVVPVVAPGSAVSGSFRPSAEQAVPSQPQSYEAGASQTATFIPAPVVQQQTPINQPAGSYRVKAGDTAWSLASAMRPDQSISVQQMLVALLRANPESFINENVNGLKRGYILRVPDYDQIAAINDEDARALVRQQAALWRQYQQSMAGEQAVSAMQRADGTTEGDAESGSQGAAGKNAYLEIVSAGTGTSTSSGKDPADMTAQELRAELALAREKVETERVEKEALRNRVDVLEQHVEKMKGMLSIEDEELSRVQSLNLPAEDATADTGPADEIAADTESTGADTGEEVADEMAAQGIAEEAAGDTEQDASKTQQLDEIFFSDEAADQSAVDQPDENMAETSQVAQSAVDAAPAQPQAEKPPAADLLTQILNDPMRLATAGGGLLLIALLTGLIIRRRKMAAESETASAFDDLDVLAESEEETKVTEAEEPGMAGSLADDQEEPSGIDISKDEAGIATGETSDQEAETSAAAEAGKPRDDVLAEADVYLAYGIYQQAEELLTQAIKDHPERNDYRLKLAETHYAGKNADAFIDTASEIKKNIDSDDSPEWKKVVAMGMDLCPDSPMFQASLADEVADTLAAEMPASEAASADEEMTLADAEMTELEDISETSELDLDDLELDDELLKMSDDDDTGAIDIASDLTSESGQLPEIEDETDSLERAEEPAEEITFDLSDTAEDEELLAEDEELPLDVDLSETGSDIEEETESELKDEIEAKEESLDIVMDEAAELDIEAPAAEEPEPEPEAVAKAEAGTGTGTDEDEEEVVLDLSDEIDVDSLEMDEIEEVKSAANDALDDDDDFDLSSLGDVDEVSTKLDLARAYLDMGDSEGTRGILEEVLADGNDEQKREANDLMAKLG